jgi:1,4-alpha-glucan branching enzyme
MKLKILGESMAISTVNNGKINFETANKFLESISLSNRQQVADEYVTLKSYVNELNPSGANYATLSEHRKSTLEKRIAKLFETIDLKLHPVHLRPSEMIQKQYDVVQTLMSRLPLSPRELRAAVKELHPDLMQKIYYAVWLASGASPEDRSGHEDLKTSGILQRKFPPLFAPIEGTLLEQIAFDLAMERERAVHKEKGDNWRLEQLTQERDNHKKTIFEAFLKNPKMNNYQKQALFETLPDTVKPQVTQPPYYGGFAPELYKTLGAHYDSGTGKTTFRVYAPNAREIKLRLTAWGNVEHVFQMIKKENGIWEVQTEHAKPGRSYYFMVVGKEGGSPFKKVDPFAFGNVIHSRELDNHESVVRDIDKEFTWTDGAWMANRVNFNPEKAPMAIYEVHPTWKKKENGDLLNWRELAVELSIYCKDMGYTHVELMALLEHPQPISMGYQITNFFTLNSEMGSIEDFQYFVNYLHKQGIGVIADWVPAHFAIDKFALCSFDGTPLFEDDDPKFARHPQWGTYEFDFKKQFTKDFLGSNLDFLLKKFHLDGVRVDAVQSILNLNYGRDAGTRLNKLGTGENLDAKAFLRNINTYAHQNYPGTLMIAEEAMGFPNLTRSVAERGIHTKTRGVGFDMTWHMGFMANVLDYFSTSPCSRNVAYPTFSCSIKDVDFNEDCRPRGKVVLAFSHDEAANGKGTIFTKMGGNSDPDKFANGRLLLAFQALRGGGPILDFMGNEILQTQEWHGRLIQGLYDATERKKASFQWEELDPRVDIHNHKYHRGARESRRALLHLYRNNPGLQDQTDAGISWIDAKDSENGVLSFHRRGGNQQFACIFNSSDKDLKDYMIPLPDASYAPELDKLIGIKEVYNSDDAAYGGQGRLNGSIEIVRHPISNRPTHLKLRLPPFTALVLEEQFS